MHTDKSFTLSPLNGLRALSTVSCASAMLTILYRLPAAITTIWFLELYIFLWKEIKAMLFYGEASSSGDLAIHPEFDCLFGLLMMLCLACAAPGTRRFSMKKTLV